MRRREKIRHDCRYWAKCGLTALSRCKKRTANLPECVGCTLVSRRADRWKMIERIPHKRCNRCGKFLPLSKFYPRKVKNADGKVYESQECVCKMCRSDMYYESKPKKIGNRKAC